jgi:preprotein translocase subunit SecE
VQPPRGLRFRNRSGGVGRRRRPASRGWSSASIWGREDEEYLVNRESKREMERQQGRQDQRDPKEEQHQPQVTKKRERTSPRTFLREVRGELKRVAWPSRKEVASYSVVVLVTVTLLTLFVFILDQAFAQIVFRIFG